LLVPGGEFAFVAFKESVSQGIISKELSSTLFLIVGLSMALTPFLADFGKVLASKYEKLETNNIETLRPKEKEVEDISNHIIICGFGRGGQTVAQFLSEHLIPFVVLDMRAERVAAGREADLPVFYGDAGSVHVLERVGLHRAKAVVVLLDTPAAMYRTVYEIHKMDPHMPVFARAHDVDHGVVLERAGARVVVPEVLEPSLQLAAAILGTYTEKWSANEIATAINKYRMLHLQDLTRSAKETGTSLGYGFKDLIEVEASKPDAKPPTSDGALKVLTPKAA
jgi:voltage-gated potassium channel Kch